MQRGGALGGPLSCTAALTSCSVHTDCSWHLLLNRRDPSVAWPCAAGLGARPTLPVWGRRRETAPRLVRWLPGHGPACRKHTAARAAAPPSCSFAPPAWWVSSESWKSSEPAVALGPSAPKGPGFPTLQFSARLDSRKGRAEPAGQGLPTFWHLRWSSCPFAWAKTLKGLNSAFFLFYSSHGTALLPTPIKEN